MDIRRVEKENQLWCDMEHENERADNPIYAIVTFITKFYRVSLCGDCAKELKKTLPEA